MQSQSIPIRCLKSPIHQDDKDKRFCTPRLVRGASQLGRFLVYNYGVSLTELIGLKLTFHQVPAT